MGASESVEVGNASTSVLTAKMADEEREIVLS